MARTRGWISLGALILLATALSRQAAAGPYDPPINYYSTATGTGATLQTQLRTIVSSMSGVNYGDARFSAPYTDPDPNVPGNILLIYNRASVDDAWDSVNLPWNREHIWPQSRLGASASNGTINIASDQFNLRPCDTDVNSTRGDLPFGLDGTTGANGVNGSYWYPGDADAGDVARAQFYMATRYSQLSLTDSSPSGLQMGDLSSLLVYHYRDVPDTFERRRNHAIYGLAGDGAPAISNPYNQENRNPFVDHPEYVWSVYADQANDSQLYVGGAPNADGSSTHNLNLGSVLVGAAVPAAQNVTLTKNGLDGTYYDVTVGGSATSSVTGRYNAFPIITAGTGSKVLSLGLNTNTTTAGLRSGTVTINNLDITTAGGSGHGNNDANDTVNVSLNVLAHANPSFTLASDQNSLDYDFGTVTLGSNVPAFQFDIANLVGTAGFTAKLDLDTIMGTGHTSVLSTDLATFNGGSALTAGISTSFFAAINTSTVGNFMATYTLNFSDENLAGAIGLGSLTLNLLGSVENTFVNTADFDEDGDVDGRDFLTWQRGFGTGSLLGQGDANNSGTVDGDDLLVWQEQFGQGPGGLAASVAIPEPASSALALLAVVYTLSRRNRNSGHSLVRFSRSFAANSL